MDVPLRTSVPWLTCEAIATDVYIPVTDAVRSYDAGVLNGTVMPKGVAVGVGWLDMVIATANVPVPDAFVALTMAFVVPRVVDEPEMRPVMVFTVNPAGRPVAPKLVGPLLAVIW